MKHKSVILLICLIQLILVSFLAAREVNFEPQLISALEALQENHKITEKQVISILKDYGWDVFSQEEVFEITQIVRRHFKKGELNDALFYYLNHRRQHQPVPKCLSSNMVHLQKGNNLPLSINDKITVVEDFQVNENVGRGNHDKPSVAMAANGVFMIAWEDSRNGNWDIYFTLLDSAGDQSTSDIRVTTDANSQTTPRIAWNGAEWGVTWLDYRGSDADLYFGRLEGGGSKIGSDIRITTDSSNQKEPSLVWTGTEYGLAWYDDRNGDRDIFFTRIGSDGVKQSPDVLISASGGQDYTWPNSLAFGTKGYGLFWSLLEENIPQQKFGVNLVVYALIHEGGINRRQTPSITALQ